MCESRKKHILSCCGKFRAIIPLQHTPHPTQGLDQLLVEALFDLVADAADEHVDDVGLRVERVARGRAGAGKPLHPNASGPKRIPDFREAEALEVGDVDGDEFCDAMENEA